MALVGGPQGTAASGTATLVGGNQDGAVGTTVTINLGGFSNATAPVAYWNGKTLKRISYTQLAGIPQSVTVQFQAWSLPPGTFPIVVKVGTEQATTAETFELEQPTILDVDPATGPWLSNFDIEIDGFPVGALNTYNPSIAGRPLTRIAINPGTLGDGPDNVIITAQVPNHAVDGIVGMRVGSLSDTDVVFDVQTPNPQANGIYPDTGPPGTTVEIEVTGYPPGTYYATFGGRPAPGNLAAAVACSPAAVLDGLSGNCVTATVPLNASGTFPFQVRVGGYSNASDQSFVIPPPTVDAYSVASAAAGQNVEIKISNFPTSGAITASVGSSPVTLVTPVPVACVTAGAPTDSCITVQLRTYNPVGGPVAFQVTRNSKTAVGPATFTVSPSADLEITVTKTPNAAGNTGTLYVWAISVKNKGFMGSIAPISTGITFPVGALASITSSSVTTPPGVTAATFTSLGSNLFACNISAGTLLPGQTATCRALTTFNVGSWTPTVNGLSTTYHDYNSANNQPAIPAVVIT